jgi:hypothetical protein
MSVGPSVRIEQLFSHWTDLMKFDILLFFESLLRKFTFEICALLGYYAASCDDCLPTFRCNVSVPSSRVKSPSRKERKPVTYNVQSVWDGARGLVSLKSDTSNGYFI